MHSLAAALGLERRTVRSSTPVDAVTPAVTTIGEKSYQWVDRGVPAATLQNRCAELRQALRDANTAVIGETIDFESLLSRTPLFRRRKLIFWSFPTNVVYSLKGNGVYYHAWVAVKRTLEEDM